MLTLTTTRGESTKYVSSHDIERRVLERRGVEAVDILRRDYLLLCPNLHHFATQLLPKVIVVADIEDSASITLQRRLELFDAG